MNELGTFVFYGFGWTFVFLCLIVFFMLAVLIGALLRSHYIKLWGPSVKSCLSKKFRQCSRPLDPIKRHTTQVSYPHANQLSYLCFVLTLRMFKLNLYHFARQVFKVSNFTNPWSQTFFQISKWTWTGQTSFINLSWGSHEKPLTRRKKGHRHSSNIWQAWSNSGDKQRQVTWSVVPKYFECLRDGVEHLEKIDSSGSRCEVRQGRARYAPFFQWHKLEAKFVFPSNF